jgi:hypothetical protein
VSENRKQGKGLSPSRVRLSGLGAETPTGTVIPVNGIAHHLRAQLGKPIEDYGTSGDVVQHGSNLCLLNHGRQRSYLQMRTCKACKRTNYSVRYSAECATKFIWDFYSGSLIYEFSDPAEIYLP